MLFSRKIICTQCGAEIDGRASFCPQCRTPTGKGSTTCGQCGRVVNVGDKFCRHCRAPLEAVRRPTMSHQSWARSGEDFAARVDVDDVEGLFRRSVVVEPGTQAIIIQDGRSLGAMPPGRYTLENALGLLGLRSKGSAIAILVDVGDTNLAFDLDLFTADPVRLAVECQITVRIDNPVLFLTNQMRGQRSYAVTQLRDFLAPEVENAADEYVHQRNVEDLNGNLSAKRDIELDIEAHLRVTLERVGLHLVQVRTLRYRCVKLDAAVRDKREEFFLEISRREAEIEGRQVLFDVLKREDVLALAEETQEVATYEQRAVIRERMRQAVLSDRMNEVRNAEELEEFLLPIDRRRLIRTVEMEELKRGFDERRQDHDAARAFLLAKLALERDHDLKQIELRQRTDLETEELEATLAMDRRRLEGMLDNEMRRQQLTLDTMRQRAEFERTQRQVDDVERRERALEDARNAAAVALQNARTQAEIDAIEREQDRLDMELGMLALEKIKTIKRRDDEERLERELAQKRALLEIELKRESAALDRRLREQSQQQQHELARMERMASMSIEALVAATGPEQARLLAQIKETELLSGWTEEQILARAAEGSPQIAAAFAEKFRNNPELQTQVVEMYERLFAEQKQALADRDQQQASSRDEERRVREQMQGMFDKALETQRDVSIGFAQNQGGQPVVVVPPSGGVTHVAGGGQTLQTDGQAKVIVCQKCRAENEPAARYCANCGADLG